MTRKHISIAITPSHYEVAMFDGNEVVGDIEWAYTPDQVAEAVKKLLTPANPFLTAQTGNEVTPADDAAYAAMQEDTEEIEPIPPMEAQIIMPHSAEFAELLWKKYGPQNHIIFAVRDYRAEYGSDLDEARTACKAIFALYRSRRS